MAVGKGSMARASKAVAKPVEVTDAKATADVVTQPVEKVEPEKRAEAEKKETVKKTVAKKTASKKPATKKTTPAKSGTVKDKAVISATSKQVMETIVYQSSSQILERDAKPNEIFFVGDDMPIYFY